MESAGHSAQPLKVPLSFADLIKGGTHFQLDGQNFEDAVNYDSDPDEYVDANVPPEDLVSPWTKSFDSLRNLMTPLGEDIYKRIVRHGNMERGLVPIKARVAIRYSAYWEGEGAPFDSTLLRDSKYEFQTGLSEVLIGLENAVLSMYPFEQAEFIIPYQLLYGERGCPPRIRQKSDALFKIEVLDFTLIGDGNALDEFKKENENKFDVILPKVKDMQLQAKDYMANHSARKAAAVYEKAINALNFCRVADEEQQAQQTALLIVLTTNVMICYNALKKPAVVCTYMKSIKNLTQNKPSCKALFHEGRALVQLCEYKRARVNFLEALKMEPRNMEINTEIIQLDKLTAKYEKETKEISMRALGNYKSGNKKQSPTANAIVDDQLKEQFDRVLTDFLNTPSETLNFPRDMYSDKEFKTLRDVAKEKAIDLNLSQLDENLIVLFKSKH